MAMIDCGPVLSEVLAAQRRDEEVVSYPSLMVYGHAIVRLSQDLGNPLLWPVGAPAERLVGAAVLLGGGTVRTQGWNSDCKGERVLLVVVSALTPLPLFSATEQAQRRGASEVVACGVDVRALDMQCFGGTWMYYPLTPPAADTTSTGARTSNSRLSINRLWRQATSSVGRTP